jgi:uncharacterized protein (TIGR00251 family)
MQDWYTLVAPGVVRIAIHAQPGASRTEIAGLHDNALKVRVAAPALEDRANAELVEFLAAQFGVPKRSVELLRGAKSRGKLFEIRGTTVDPAGLLVGQR